MNGYILQCVAGKHSSNHKRADTAFKALRKLVACTLKHATEEEANTAPREYFVIVTPVNSVGAYAEHFYTISGERVRCVLRNIHSSVPEYE